MGKYRSKKKESKESKKMRSVLAIRKRWDKQKQMSVESESQPVPGPSGVTQSLESNVFIPLNTRQLEFDSVLNMIEENTNLDFPDYTLFNMKSVRSIVECLACPLCHSQTVKIYNKSRMGFAKSFCIFCENCEEEIKIISSSDKIPNSGAYDVNRRMVKSFTTMGKGVADMERMCMIMNMDPISKDTFSSHKHEIYKASKVTGLETLSAARKRVREHYKSFDPSVTDESVLDIGVIFDGTWHKRGFTSNYGIGCVIEATTGLVIDFCVKSKFCRNCAVTKARLGKDSAEFLSWYADHELQCDKNYDGSSPGMETSAAQFLWNRSLMYKLRYTSFIGDGDSKVYSSLKDSNIYGPSITIEKLECVNHVSKRLGTALRKLVQTCRAQKITLGGKAPGSLKESTILKLTRYYHNAIAKNVSQENSKNKTTEEIVTSMRNDILATLHHATSTDAKPQHTKCPVGKNSWCFYNRAQALGKTPGGHEKNIGTPINLLVLKHIADIYTKVTSRELLRRCVKGVTQNANESLHSRIWKHCDKARCASKKMVEMAAAAAVGEFNFGSSSIISSMERSHISPGSKSTLIGRRQDLRRKKRLLKKKSDEYQERRRKLRLKHAQKEETLKEKEGIQYEAGGF